MNILDTFEVIPMDSPAMTLTVTPSWLVEGISSLFSSWKMEIEIFFWLV